MAILAFQKPEEVIMVEASNFYGKFEFKPLEPGYGITVGNALRRVLLSSLEGFAISSIKIDGVKNEFDAVPGVKEDVTNIILNLKQVDLKQKVEDDIRFWFPGCVSLWMRGFPAARIIRIGAVHGQNRDSWKQRR